jgi:hypothetical protein
MTEPNDNAPITITLKGGKDFSDPWIVLRGSNPQQVTDMLRNLGELPQAVVEASEFFHATNNAAPVLPQQQAPSGWGNSQPQQAAPAQQGATLHPEGKQCNACGQVLQFKQVNRKSDGKTFKFWSCPNGRNRDDGHTSEFAS